MDLEVAQLVDDHVVDAVDRDTDKIDVECDVAGLGAASPTLSHLTNGQPR